MNLTQRMTLQEEIGQIDETIQAMEKSRAQALVEVRTMEDQLAAKYANLDKIYSVLAQQSEIRAAKIRGLTAQ